MAGTLTGIARRPVSRAPMEELSHVTASPDFGVEGDSKGLKFPKRQVTLLQRELWEEALLALGNPRLSWTARRANLLVEGLHLPRGVGSEIAVGTVRLEVTAETTPCARMDEMYHGLRRALAPDCRGGVTARVLEGGVIARGDPVKVLREVIQPKAHLRG